MYKIKVTKNKRVNKKLSKYKKKYIYIYMYVCIEETLLRTKRVQSRNISLDTCAFLHVVRPTVCVHSWTWTVYAEIQATTPYTTLPSPQWNFVAARSTDPDSARITAIWRTASNQPWLATRRTGLFGVITRVAI